MLGLSSLYRQKSVGAKGDGELEQDGVTCLSDTGSSLQVLLSSYRLSFLHMRRTIHLIHVQWEGALQTGCLILTHDSFSAGECSET